MIDGVDATRPVQLTPNEPGTRSEWWVPMADGYMHHVTASVWRYANEWYPVGTINVHIGCGVLITDTVRDGETEWQALARVVYTWQAETREADHAAALEIMAMVDAQMVEANHPAETPAPVETAAPVITRTMPLGDVHSAHCTGCGWRVDDSPVSLYTDAVSHWVESGGHETVHGYRNMWGEYRVSGRFAGDPSKRHGQ